ncbi:MAG: ATP-binding protein [Gemmataceae bacterium]
MPDSLRVLIIDDDVDTCSNLQDILELDNCRVEIAGSFAEAIKDRDWKRFAAILLDRRLPDGLAEDFLPLLRERAPQASIIIITGFADLNGAISALRHGATDYILKPINPDVLRATLARLIERRRLTRAKEQSETAFRTLVHAAPCLILIVRPDYTVCYFSKFAEQMTGFAESDLLGHNCVIRLIPEEHRATALATLDAVFAGQVVRGIESRVLCANGSSRWTLWNAIRLPDYDGAPAALVVGQDITGMKLAQERTLQAERLAAIGQMVTGLAHESGNALARSQACLEMLRLEVGDRPEALNLIDRLQKAQDHLQRLYEEVRNYAAPLILERKWSSLDRIWQQAWASLSERRQGRQADVFEDLADTDLVCLVDAFRLEQVFRNIFENALSACKDPVEIMIRCRPATLHDQPAVLIEVRDNGPGLTPEQAQRIFEPFYTTKTKGTGLGMAICQRIVEAHGGQISAGGQPTTGAIIRILLPKEGVV